jgi:hypothetical protein
MRQGYWQMRGDLDDYRAGFYFLVKEQLSKEFLFKGE